MKVIHKVTDKMIKLLIKETYGSNPERAKQTLKEYYIKYFESHIPLKEKYFFKVMSNDDKISLYSKLLEIK